MRIGARARGVALVGCLSCGVLGCGSTTSNDQPSAEDGETGAGGSDTSDGATSSADVNSATSSGGSGTGGASATGEVSSTSDTTGTTGDCLAGVPATSQVPRLLNREYDTILYDLLGVSSLATAGDQPPSSLLQADFEGDMTRYAWEGYLEAARQVAAQVMAGEDRSRFMNCDPAADTTCYQDTIAGFGRKVFRRPLTEEELTRFTTLTTDHPDWTPEQISEAILFAFLVSPSFIMVPELSVEPEGTAFKRSSYEVATRLSLMLWGSIPDEDLNAAADQGMLATFEQIRAQAERMIQLRDKAAPQVSASHEAYLGSSADDSHWWQVDHDPALFPSYTEDTRAALQGEVAAYFEEVAYMGGSFQDIFLSNIAFVNQDSAAIYGLDATEYGAELTRVELDATERPGIFTRAGFLSSYSTWDATNPILRGAFLANFVLGVDPGPPTPDAIVVELPEGTYLTRREQIEALTSVRADCAACHALLNPPGFVLENFDTVGSWQDIDPLGGPIDSTAEVTFADGSVRTVSSALELMQAITTDHAAQRIYAEKLVAFFTGREPNANDACMVDAIATKLASGGSYSLLDVVVDLTQVDSFRLRTVEN